MRAILLCFHNCVTPRFISWSQPLGGSLAKRALSITIPWLKPKQLVCPNSLVTQMDLEHLPYTEYLSFPFVSNLEFCILRASVKVYLEGDAISNCSFPMIMCDLICSSCINQFHGFIKQINYLHVPRYANKFHKIAPTLLNTRHSYLELAKPLFPTSQKSGIKRASLQLV